MYNPNPVPPIPDVEKNLENKCGNVFEFILLPVSLIFITISSDLSLLPVLSLSLSIPFLFSISMLIVPSFVNLIALSKILDIICIILSLSPSITISLSLIPLLLLLL